MADSNAALSASKEPPATIAQRIDGLFDDILQESPANRYRHVVSYEPTMQLLQFARNQRRRLGVFLNAYKSFQDRSDPDFLQGAGKHRNDFISEILSNLEGYLRILKEFLEEQQLDPATQGEKEEKRREELAKALDDMSDDERKMFESYNDVPLAETMMRVIREDVGRLLRVPLEL